DTSKPLPFDAEWLPVRTNSVQCALPLISAQILSDGTTSFCGCANFDGRSELNIGNIATTSLREMMASDRVRQLWNWTKFGVPEFCPTCSFHFPIDHLGGLSPASSAPLGPFGGSPRHDRLRPGHRFRSECDPCLVEGDHKVRMALDRARKA